MLYDHVTSTVCYKTATPQQSLAIEQFKFSSLSNIPPPSSSDEESNASPLSVEEFKNVDTKEVLKSIPKEIKVH